MQFGKIYNLNSKEVIYFQGPRTKLDSVALMITDPPPMDSATEIDTHPKVIVNLTVGCFVVVCFLKKY